jgi:adenylate cyclase
MLGKLTPCGGGPPILLLKPKLVVGRHPSCDIPLDFSTVSARHCELTLTDGYWFVRDLGSTNGVRVNGTVCQTRRLLPKDVLWVAAHRFTVLYAPPSGTPPPAEPELTVALKEQPRPAGPSASAAEVSVARPGSSAGPSLGKLVPCGGGPPIPLLQPRIIVGRHPTCDVVLRFSSVSSEHCELEWTDGGWFVRDLGSHNGIRVDGVRCREQRLPPGCVLWIANLRYEVVYTGKTAGAAPVKKGPVFGQGLLDRAGLATRQLEPPSGDAEDSPRRRHSLDDPDAES